MEELETRVVPYSISSNMWPSSQLVTVSFMPDGTDLGGVKSNLFATMNARFGSSATWQNQILKAAQVFAKHTDLNLVVVPDNGAPSGSGAYQQGDPEFGDIRIGGYNFGNSALASAFAPPPINNYSIAGDIAFNTAQTWNIGATYDLFTVAAHEFGHAYGLLHSSVTSSAMYSVYNGVRTGLDWDDIFGIRDIYTNGTPRSADWNDANGGNDSFAAATDVTQHIQSDLTLLRQNRDITTCSDVDYFKVTAPWWFQNTVLISAQSADLSMLAPKITVYAADQTTILGSANGAGQYGASQTVTLNDKLTGGQVFYIKVQGADSSPFGTGKYALSMSMAGAPLPTQAPAKTELPNGNPLSGGGGMPMVPRLSQAHGDSDGSVTEDRHGGGCGCPACQTAIKSAVENVLVSAVTTSALEVSEMQLEQQQSSSESDSLDLQLLNSSLQSGITESDITSSGTESPVAQPADETASLIDMVLASEAWLF
jgi:hypothetical protein